MEETLILLSEYCANCEIEPDFVYTLEREGLIELITLSDEYYVNEEQLHVLERYRRWHYELQVNMEGMEVMQHLLNKINRMRAEIAELRNRLKLYE